MRQSLFMLFVLIGIQACVQHGKFAGQYEKNIASNKGMLKSERAGLILVKRGKFKNYAFKLDGKIIQQRVLIHDERAVLDHIFPYETLVGDHLYSGALLFHTADQPEPLDTSHVEPAYFINGTQVSLNNVRWSKPEAYNRINRSIKDTIIDGVSYQGCIYIDTDEDFFAGRMPLSQFLKSYGNMPPIKDLIIHWYQPTNRYDQISDIGMVIQNRFPLYYISQKSIDLMEIFPIQFANSKRFVVGLRDHWYHSGNNIDNKWSSRIKAHAIFEEPSSIDPTCPCYIADFDKKGEHVFHATELNPEPYQGEEVYLQKLSTLMALHGKESMHPIFQDSISVQFIVTKTGMLTGLESISPDQHGHERILQAIRRHSCPWSVGMFSGRSVLTKRKMTIFYSKDQYGNIRSLDRLLYRYDD